MVRYSSTQNTKKGRLPQLLHPVIVSERVYIAQNITCSLDQIFHCFSTDAQFEYEPVLDEFGPLRLSSVTRFVELLSHEIAAHPRHKIVYYAGGGTKNLTTAVYLLGAYMILKHGETALAVSRCFGWIDDTLIEPFHAASLDDPAKQGALSLLDCWSALEQAKQRTWLALPRSKEDSMWGQIDPDEYEHYHNPLNAGLHQIIPAKLLIHTAPVNLNGRDYVDAPPGVRRFSPSYILGIFDELGVSAVACLGVPAYDPREFAAAGVAHYNLETSATSAALDRLLAAADAAGIGAVAVHAGGGAGGEALATVLAALFLVRRCGFAARAAAAWVRICRPGPEAAAALPAVLRRSGGSFGEHLASPHNGKGVSMELAPGDRSLARFGSVRLTAQSSSTAGRPAGRRARSGSLW